MISCNTLLFKIIIFYVVRPVYAWWKALFSGAILLLGVSGPLHALPGNSQIEDDESSFNLNFPSTTPITLSKMMVVGRTEFNDVRKGPKEYDLNPEVARIGNMATGTGGGFPSDTSLTREKVNASRLSSEGSGAFASSTPRITLATATQTGADKLVSNIDEVPSIGEDIAIESKMPLREAAKSPYATITLAFLALLGLVSVARRDDIG